MAMVSPKVTIGLPVYNGEQYLREALDSILAQSYTDFELVISDNGSNDATERICRDYASADSRIRYYRNEVNRGPEWNYRNVFELAAGEYFKWMNHDDRIAPQFLEKCVQVLDTCPSAILCCAKLRLMDETSSATPYLVERDISHAQPHRRYRRVLRQSDYALEIHALMRKDALRNTPLMASYPSSDLVLLARLALMGRFVQIPEYMVDYRIHSQQSTSRDRFRLMEWWDPRHNGRMSFPQWKLFLQYMACIRAVPLSPTERFLCYVHLLCWPAWERNWRRLGKDLLIALPLVPRATACFIMKVAVSPSNHGKLDRRS